MTRPALVAWMLDHAREDFARGRAVPPDLADGIRALMDEHSSENRTETAEPETLGIGVTEKAIELGCSPEYVRRLCRTGRLPARRIGRRDWLITTQERHDDDRGPADLR